MTRTWVALLDAVPAGADRSAPVQVEGQRPAVLAGWTAPRRPHPLAGSIDPRIVGAGGPEMRASWVLLGPDERPLFDAPEVLHARRSLLRHWPAYGASSLVSDSVHLAGSVLLGPVGDLGDDPFARLGERRLLLTQGFFVPLAAPTGPALERYGGQPWPYDRFPPD